MRLIAFFLLSVAAVPSWAQETLPERFFIECKQMDWSVHILLFVDRTKGKISMKIPILLEETLHEDDDSLYFMKSGSKNYFNKWNRDFRFNYSSLAGKNCEILDPESRNPIFK